MRGDPGTPIKLTIVRPGRDKPFDVSMVRERIELRPVKWEIKDGIGYININTFSGNVGDQTKSALVAIDKATGGHPLGYVVDLRSNPGGLLDQAVDVADVFLDSGEIVSQRGREKDDIERYYARPGDMAHGLPVIVLIDAGTASASEIVAGALQDHRRALIMGEKSFGKGSVQTVVQTGPESALRLTTARYYTPSGRSVQAGGIEPDIIVPQLSRLRLQGPQGRSRGRSSPPSARPGEGRGQVTRSRRHARSALLGETRRAGEEGHQGLPALLRAQYAEAARRPVSTASAAPSKKSR